MRIIPELDELDSLEEAENRTLRRSSIFMRRSIFRAPEDLQPIIEPDYPLRRQHRPLAFPNLQPIARPEREPVVIEPVDRLSFAERKANEGRLAVEQRKRASSM